jgi:xanthine dehydrogenase YagS FAD-binding subunit
MKEFEWANAESVDEAVKLLAEIQADDSYESPRAIAGGQDLLTTMKERVLRPSRVVNLKTIPGLNHLEYDPAGGLKIGALVKLHEIETNPDVIKNFPGLSQAAHSIASVQLRNQGTVGGNLCQRPRCWYFRLEEVTCLKKGGDTCYAAQGENKYHAILGGGPSYIVHPSDLATMLVCLDATVSVAGPKGKRSMPLANFFTLPAHSDTTKENVLDDAELVTEVQVPASAMAARSAYVKMKERQSLDFAMAAAAAAVTTGPDGKVTAARMVLGGVAPTPWPVPKAAASLIGKSLDEQSIAAAAEMALDGAKPLAKNAYKVPLAKALMRRALQSLATA